MGFGANSQKDMQNVALIISSKTLPENDDSAAFDSIVQVDHRFFRNGVQQEFQLRVPKYRFDERH